MRKVFLLLFSVFCIFLTNAQTTLTFNSGAALTADHHSGPIYRSSASSSYDFCQFAYYYAAGELSTLPSGSSITKLAWNKTSAGALVSGASTGTKFRIYLKNSSTTGYTVAQTFATLISGASLAYENLNQDIPATTGWLEFSLNTPFTYTGGSLEIMVDWDVSAFSGSPATAAFSWEKTTVNNSILGYADAAAITGSLSTTSNSIGTITNTRPTLQLTYTGGTACSGTPVAGSAISNFPSICLGAQASLSVTGATTGVSGITFQWQDSSAAATWTDISGAVNATYNPTITSVTAFRRKTTCGSSTSTSSSVVVNVNNPTFATLPFTESFENTWIDACSGTRVIPNNNWRNNPITTNNSWRRNDDAANGWFSTSGAYTPTSSAGTYSARFHSYDASSGTSGTFDLHLNCSSGSPDKRLTFDYINTSGTDFLELSISTDGGATFNPVSLPNDTIRVRTAWSQKIWEFNSSSATTVLRFRAQSDFGTTDIGIDNINIITLTNCIGMPNGGITVSSSVTVCSNIVFGLSVTGSNTDPAGISVQWQDSTAGGNWLDIAGATSLTLSTSQLEAKGYRRRISCMFTGLDSFSKSIWVPLAAPTFATLPFTEGFENTWVNVCGGTRVVPSNNWRNNPITSDSSWRRNDDASNGWTSTAGAYSPVSSTGSFSARFHTYQTSSGRSGRLDLHVDCSSGNPDKRLTFDYINTSGSDFLELSLSTDGGVTFNPINLANDTLRVRSTWFRKTWDFNSSSATTILRFRAQSDFGTTDIGIDNVSVVTIPAIDAAATSFVTPTGSMQVSSAGTITLKVTNTGINPIDFATNNAVVGVRVINPNGVATNYTVPVNTGGVNANSTTDITITSTANFSSLGTYILKGGITLTGDGNTLNDSTSNVSVIANPLVKTAIVSGNWGDGSTWSDGLVPTATDSVNITGYNVTLEGAAAAPYTCYSIGIGANGTLTGGAKALTIGPSGGGKRAFTIASTGTLAINAVTNITHNGFLLFNSGSNFTMSGGTLIIDGNDGTNDGSVSSANDILGFGTSTVNMASGTFNVTGGTIQIIDPHRFSGSYALAYRGASGYHINFGVGNTVVFGDGTTGHISNGVNGFLHDPYLNSGRLSYGNLTINGGSSPKRFVSHPFTFGVTGDFTINAGSDYRANSGINVGGNFVNNGVFASASVVGIQNHLNGTNSVSTVPQTISGNGRFRNNIPTAAINTAGTGYTVGSILILTGGTAIANLQMIITSVDGTGGITGVSISNMGNYSVAPTFPAAVSGGTGSGATFTITNLLPTASLASFTVNNNNPVGVTINGNFQSYPTQTGTISGTLTLTSGIIDNTSPLVLGISTGSRGTLTYTAGFFKGKFGRWFSNATNTTTTGDFPVGKDTVQMARVEFTTAPTKGGVLTAEFVNTSPGFAGLPLTDGSATLNKVATDGFWRVENDTIAGGTYRLSLTARKFVGINVLATLTTVKRPNNGTTWTLDGSAGTNTGTIAIPVVVRNGMIGFSEFAIAAGADNVLPYTKLSFVGIKTANGNKLNWTVTNEFNSKGYQLERSIDGINFTEISYLASKNLFATPSNTEYTFTDFAPFKGNTYYRLKQMDNDGRFSYSNVVLMRGLKVTALSIAGVYPNPTSSIINLIVASPTDKQIALRVVDVNGKIVIQQNRAVTNGDNIVQLNIQSLASGTYSILATCKDGCETKAHVFVKQ